MSATDDILNAIPVDKLAAQLGVDPETAKSAVKAAVPALALGLGANAQDPAGAASLEGALADHKNDPTESGTVDLDAVDTADGEKIVANVFGDKEQQVVSQLGGVQALGATGNGPNVMAKLLPLLAPLVLGYIAKRVVSGGGDGGAAGAQNAQVSNTGSDGGGGLADILSSLTKGSGASQAGAGAGGGSLTDLLGGLLGGGRR